MERAITYLSNLLKENDRVVVCLSGGPDSMCLLSLLINLRNKKNINIIAAHVNHNVRKVSIKEEAFVKKYCLDNNVVFETMKIENYHNDNFHNEARKIRYDYFEGVVKKHNAKYLMTAHHADDLMETILMRLVRGSSFSGYSGFKKEVERNNYLIIRPLIENTKKEILIYNKENKIPFVIDKSNKKDKYTRNRYRKKVLPFLKKEDKNVHEKFIKFSNMLNEYNSYFSEKIEKIINQKYKNKVLNISNFNNYEKIIQIKIIEYILEETYDEDLFLINDTHTKEIINLINNKSNKKINLPNNIVVQKSYDELNFSCQNKETKEYEFKLKEKIILPDNKVIEIVNKSEDTSNYVTRILSSEIELPLIVRTRQNGDKMTIKKMNGSKKIKDIFINEKIKMSDRDTWPIVTDSNNNIIWLPGIKKSKFDKSKNEKYDIIIKCNLKEKKNEKKQR